MNSATTAWKRLIQLLRAERQEVRSIYTFGIFQGLVGLSLPLGIQAIITFIQAGQLSPSWDMLVAFVLGGILIGGYLQLKQLTVTETIEQRLFVNTAFHFADRLPRLSLKDLDQRYMPETLNRFFEIVTIQKGISKMLIDFSAAIIQVVFGVIILSLYHPAFLILAAIITIIITAFFKYSGPKGLSTSMQESKYKFKVAYWLQEVGRALRSFKLAGDSTLPVERTNELTVSYLKSRNAHFQVLIRQYRVLILVKLILAGMLIVIGSVLVINNMINIGQFVAAEIIILLLINSIEKIILNMSTVYDVLTSLDKLGGALDLTLERNSGIPLPDSDTAALTLEISDLQFQFDDAQKPLLSGVQLRVKSGETICIQGDDGSGKTTLIRLLSGYYEDYSGTIAYNQLSLKAIELQSLRAQIGENFSENEIFAGSILDNISCGRPSIDSKAAMDALHKVELKNWFMHQPQGLETLLTPEGQGLPGHIRRRLMLARIFAGKPRLLLIEDSPMMQSQNERQLFYQLLFAHCKDITTIVISNDPSISSRCIQTYVLQNGQLIPQTTHS